MIYDFTMHKKTTAQDAATESQTPESKEAYPRGGIQKIRP